MTFSIIAISRCSGTNHITVGGTVAGEAVTRMYQASDFTSDEWDNFKGVELAILSRLKSYCKENGLNTFTEIKNGLEGKTFKV